MNFSKIVKLLLLVALLGIAFYQSYGPDIFSGTDGSSVNASAIPAHVMDVLQTVQSTGKAPKNFVGGRTFQNREKRLPKNDSNGKKLKYKEWDVNRKVKGKNRGAERLVTGSDGSAYYTDDHYKTFKKIE